MVLPGELAKQAVGRGLKAVTQYTTPKSDSKADGKKKKRTEHARAGLKMPVTRIGKYMMAHTSFKRKGAGAAVYLTAVVEYMAGEILELAGNYGWKYARTKKRITPRTISYEIDSDEELARLFGRVVQFGGVVPYINKAYIPKKPAGKLLDE
jgi:histone H2A